MTALKSFVQGRGTIVTLGTASNFATEKLGVRARNVCQICHRSASGVRVRPLSQCGRKQSTCYGMPKESLALYLSGDPVFQITPSSSNEKYTVIVSYQDLDVLQNGWLVGEGNITGKAAMISAEIGKGKVVLIGLRSQHRAQTYGTFKLLFNSLQN